MAIRKKRTTIITILLMLIPSMLSASFSYRLDLLSFDPIYREYTADRNRAGMDFQYAVVDKDGFPKGFYQDDRLYGGAVYYPFTDVKENNVGFRQQPFMALLHVGETLSLMRNTFTFDSHLSPIAFDFSFQGQIDFGFEGAIADIFGYDGWYFFGGTASIADIVSIRAGLHHVCTHMGDGTIKLSGLDLADRYPDAVEQAGMRIYRKYIRMNAVDIGISIEPVKGLRLYVDYNFLAPGVTEAMDTHFFAPHWYEEKYRREDQVYNREGSDYRGDMINFGIEISYPIFRKLGNTTLAYDCRAYEEGKIVYKVEDMENKPDWVPDGWNAYYDPDRPWEFEFNVLLEQQLNSMVSLEIGYHHTRFPINTFYHQRCDWVHFGGRLNFDGTVTLVDTSG